MTTAADLPVVESAPAAAPVTPEATAERLAAPIMTVTPPCVLEAEMAALGAMLMDKDAAATCAKMLRPQDFVDPAHQKLFRFLAEHREPGETPDLVTVIASLRAVELLESVGGKDYILTLCQSYGILGNVKTYCSIIRRAAIQRTAIQAGLDLARQAAEPKANVPELLKSLAQRMQRVTEPSTLGKPLTVAELLRTYSAQREPVIDPLIRRGEVGNLISGPKLFKSWLLMQVALCVVLGRDFLGFLTKMGRVLLLDYELHAATLAKRLYLMMTAMGVTADDIGDRLVIEPLRGKRLDIDGMGDYFAAIPPRRFDLVIADPLYHVFPEGMDENDNAAITSLYGRLQHYAENLDAALIVVHHLSKGDQSFKSVTDLGSGGGAQSRAADAHLAIRPHAQEGVGVLSGVLRSFPPFDAFCIRREFPLWVEARDLDPLDLRRPQPRRSKAPAVPTEPPAPAWTVERFAAEILTDAPQTRAAVLDAATEAGVSNVHQATRLLELAEAAGKAFRWRIPKDKRTYFAAQRQPTLTGETP